MFDRFTQHPKDKGMTYLEHFMHANELSLRCFKIAYALFIHAYFPHLFQDYASDKIKELAKDV